MQQGLIQFSRQQNLFNHADRLLLTVSGGIDSIVMADLFSKTSLPFGIAHCNFSLRGKESDEDEVFVKNLAKKYRVPFHHITFKTQEYADAKGISIQMAARELRYKWFEKLRKQFGYQFIATAHHKDDAIETFFINLLRGTGIAGLHGILPRQGKVVRPLLFADRKDIEQYARENKLRWREDSSNISTHYLRNKIRHRLIPLLKEINPIVEETIENDMERLCEVEQVFKQTLEEKRKQIIKKEKGRFFLEINELKKLVPLKTMLFGLLKEFGFNESTVGDIITGLQGVSGKTFHSETHRIVKDRQRLIITKSDKNLKQKKSFLIQEKDRSVELDNRSLLIKKIKITKKFKINPARNVADLDMDRLSFPLKVRKWITGDIFQPLGMKQHKKLSDFFIDNKVSVPDKESCLLVISGNKIAWVAGYRVDERFKVTAATKNIYRLELT